MTEMFWNFFELLINIFQGFAMIYFPYKYFGGKYSDKFTGNYGIWFSLIVALEISLFNQMTIFEHLYAVFYGITIFLYSFIFLKGNKYNKLFISALSMLIPMISGATNAGLVSIIFNRSFEQILAEDNNARALGLVFTQLSIIYLYYFIIKIFTKNKNDEHHLTKSDAFLISVTIFLSVIIGSILCTTALENIGKSSRLLIFIGFICLLIINIIILYISVDLRIKNNVEIQNEKLKIIISHNKQYIENADNEYQVIRKLRHDTKDTYRVIDDYLLNNEIEKAREYIRKIVKIADDKILFVNTDNKIVNSVINSKLTFAKSYGINATCLCINDYEGIDDIDLCRLLSNMLENAVTATSNCNLLSKSILLRITYEQNQYIFLLKNSIDNSVLTENPELSTNKSDFVNHGYGVKIIRDIAEKYHGHCDFYEEDNMFCCLVVLNIG